MKNEKHTLLVAVFAGSLACLAYEIALTRIFSITFSYHFAFIVISVAMLGIGASGTVLAVYPKFRDLRLIPLYALLLGITIPCSYLLTNSIPFDPARLAWDRMQILYMVLYSIVLSIPFLFFGLIVSSVFAGLSSGSGYVYAVDLTGASIGSIGILYLLSRGGPEQAVFLIASLPLLSVFFFSRRRLKILSVAVLSSIALFLSAGPDLIRPRISPYKPLSVALQFPDAALLKTHHGHYSQVDVFTSPVVRSAPGMSFRYAGGLPLQLGISVDAGEIHAITRERDRGSLRFIHYLPSSLAYLLTGNDEVLVIDPRGGLAVLTARYHGSKRVYAVESDPLVLQAVREQAQQSGENLYRENAWSGLGRAWLASRKDTFDVIDLSSLGSLPGWAFGFAEDYRFTVEAFQEYLSHLKHDGVLSLNLFMVPPPRAELRLLSIITTALERHGVQDVSHHLAAIRSWGTLTVIVKRSALTDRDIERIKRFSTDMQFDLVYYPGIKETESNRYVRMADNRYFDAFQRLIDPRARQRFIHDYLFDIHPVYDEQPFFHYFLRLKNLKDIYRIMGEKWQFFIEEGYLLPVLLIQMTVVSVVLIILPVFRLTRRPSSKNASGLVLTLIYFSALGMGFMFVEVSLIQKMILPLEHPPYAMSTVILGILIGSGAGSFLSERVHVLRHPRTVLLLSGIIALATFLLPEVMKHVTMLPWPFKSMVVVLLSSLLGLVMGIPFPLGISFLQKFDQGLIPWAWAVNGCFSVVAPVAAIMLAVTTGFSIVLFSGAIMYLCAFVSFTAMKRAAEG